MQVYIRKYKYIKLCISTQSSKIYIYMKLLCVYVVYNQYVYNDNTDQDSIYLSFNWRWLAQDKTITMFATNVSWIGSPEAWSVSQDHEAAKPMCIPWRGSKISRGCIQEAWIYPASDFDSTSTSGSVKRCSLFPATTACRRVPGEWLDTPKLLGASMATTSMASIGIAAGVLRCPYDSVWFNTYCVLMFLA